MAAGANPVAPVLPKVPPKAVAKPLAAIEGYEGFELHGPNWLDGSNRPVAVLWGVAAWQRGYVAQYLPEERAAFVRPKTPWPETQAALDRLEGIRFIVWDDSAVDEAIRGYAQRRGIPIARMKDGLIRSRGRDKTVPYSVILDEERSTGGTAPGFEALLNSHDFSSSQLLLNSVPALIQVHRKLRIGKYNTGGVSSASRVLGPKLKRRVLVVGERLSASAPALEHNAAGTWDARRLVELAAAENPLADIVFRPHPADVKAYRKESAAREELGVLCRVIANDVTMADLLAAVDQVYVDTSLAGMEALVHGLPVTVVGAPFYAGWGLTDDRQVIQGRGRQLSLEELYCAVYLLRARYLADLDDPVTGCLATMIRLTAERRHKLDAELTTELVMRHCVSMALTDDWPVLLRPENLEPLAAKYDKLLSVFSIERIFASCRAQRFQRSIAYLIAGHFSNLPSAAGYLSRLSTSVPTKIYQQVLLDLWRMNPSPEILEQLAWCAEQAGDFAEARSLLEHLAFGGEHRKDVNCRLPFASSDYPRIIRLAQFELNQKQFDRAEELFNWLLLSGCLQPDAFVGLATIARQRFDFTSATSLLGVARRLHPTWFAGRAHLAHAQACSLTDDAVGALESMALACLINPQHAAQARTIQHILDEKFGVLPYDEAMLLASELGESDNIIGRAKGLIAHERHNDAERLLLRHAPRPAKLVRHALTLSMAYSFQGKLAEAITLVSRLLVTSPTLPVFHEGLRLAVMANDYAWARSLILEARKHQLEINNLFERKIALGLGDIRESYLTFRKMKVTGTVRSYLGPKYVQSVDEFTQAPGGINLVVADFGPGDEIRFATTYSEIGAAGGDSRVVFTCDPRLLGLLRRHYTQLEFVPSARIRNLSRLKHFDDHDQLPGSELHVFFDNRGWAETKTADKIILVSDALGDVIDGYASFKGLPCLKADPALVVEWRGRLEKHRQSELLVGLSWRSSLLSYARNEHYLAVEDLLPLFELEGVRFVNLQYDDCRKELAWLEQRFPGKMLHFEDLDQFDDLDGVAALMECLDLVVAPATAVVELAGALGRPTFLLSNSSELQWRKIPGSRMDTWHNSIMHIEAPVLGDKNGLVCETAAEIRRMAATCQPKMAAVA